MSKPNITRKFILAGKAVFTVQSATGEHMTFRVVKAEENEKFKRPSWFAFLLTGPDNEVDYTYVCKVSPKDLELWVTANSAYRPESKIFRVLKWAMSCIFKESDLPDGYSIQHDGRCGRCGRTLTTPESIKAGFGPECIKSRAGVK